MYADARRENIISTFMEVTYTYVNASIDNVLIAILQTFYKRTINRWNIYMQKSAPLILQTHKGRRESTNECTHKTFSLSIG